MALFNLRLSDRLQARLHAEASKRGVSRSDIAREAITDYLTARNAPPPRNVENDDNWSEFGAAVIAAQRRVLSSLLDNLETADWQTAVEPVYAAFRDMTIAKSRGSQNPSIFTRRGSSPHEPYVEAFIGFASDDSHAIQVSLEQLFSEYAWFAGLDAFAEIPSIWQQAKGRLDRGEAQPDEEQIAAARVRPETSRASPSQA